MTTASAAAGRTPVTVTPAPTWVRWTTLALALLGLAASTYLTITHFEPRALHCSVNGVFDCAAVTTSAQSRFLGIPVAFLGLAQYVCMTVLCTPQAWRSQRREVHLARLVFAAVGMAFVLWLLIAELLIIGHICEYCTGVHVVTFALFVCIVTTVPSMLGWGEER
ncbi:MAG TPA: vitamin K epoxide reductase family protein [Acidimicrobiales bacterium]|nr:vitamin K epoxide reductase family protein [Acidimicrobiales bacterium]